MNRVALDRVRDIRSEKGLNQSELARRTGFSQSTISYVEKNGRGSYEQAQKFASALGVEIAELSFAGKRALDRKPVPLGVSVNGEHTYRSERDTPIRGTVEVPDPHPRGRATVLRIEPSEALLERVDRLLDILEASVRERV